MTNNKIIFLIKIGGKLLYWVKKHDNIYLVFKKDDENFSKKFNTFKKCIYYIFDDWIYWNYSEKDNKQIEIKIDTDNILLFFSAILKQME